MDKQTTHLGCKVTTVSEQLHGGLVHHITLEGPVAQPSGDDRAKRFRIERWSPGKLWAHGERNGGQS